VAAELPLFSFVASFWRWYLQNSQELAAHAAFSIIWALTAGHRRVLAALFVDFC